MGSTGTSALAAASDETKWLNYTPILTSSATLNFFNRAINFCLKFFCCQIRQQCSIGSEQFSGEQQSRIPSQPLRSTPALGKLESTLLTSNLTLLLVLYATTTEKERQKVEERTGKNGTLYSAKNPCAVSCLVLYILVKPPEPSLGCLPNAPLTGFEESGPKGWFTRKTQAQA